MSVKVDVFKSFELSCKALIHPVSWATNGGGLLSPPTVAKTVLRLTLKMAAGSRSNAFIKCEHGI
jgi:hypothetical protein